MTTGNDLSILLSRQRLFMQVLGIDPASGTMNETDVPSKEELGAAIGIVKEASEILEAMDNANRIWKVKDVSPSSEVKEELIDVVFFVLELAILLGLSGDDLVKLYNDKYRKNLKRLYIARAKKGTSMPVSPLLITLMETNFTKNELEVVHEQMEA